ncbi:helix-turn-helix domain-containing protein [Ekhidna sp.]
MANEKAYNPFEVINNQLDRIETLLSDIDQRIVKLENNQVENDRFMDINEASEFLGDAKATLYGRTSKNEIQFYKRGKKVYFKKSDLVKWIEGGRMRTIDEIKDDVRKRL